jgi:hypothetical protein
MEEAYEFINVEKALIAVVASLASASVDVPSPRPAQFVQVNRAGGPAGLVTDSPMVTFFVWGPTWSAAHDLAAAVRRVVHSVTKLGGSPVYRVLEIGGLARAPDPVDGSPRYQFTTEIRVRGFKAS